MAGKRVDALPEECLSHVISFTSPRDACRSAVVCPAFHAAADSDATWEGFLPWDYREIISRSVSPVEFSSKKDLFRRLSRAPLLIDGGKMVIFDFLNISRIRIVHISLINQSRHFRSINIRTKNPTCCVRDDFQLLGQRIPCVGHGNLCSAQDFRRWSN